MPVTTPSADTLEGEKSVMAQRVIVLLDRLSRLPCGSEPWLDIFRALQHTLEAHTAEAI